MDKSYSTEISRWLTSEFESLRLHRPMRIRRYEPGTELSCSIRPVAPGPSAGVRLNVEKFAGGGFAGQVYQVRLLSISRPSGPESCLEGTALRTGGVYAMKIMIPPSRAALVFRNLLYAVGFQGPFQLQVNPSAARAGALWQKFIRAAAKHRFKDPHAVNDVHATLIDGTLGACGEISDWVEGRTWRLEVDDHMDLLRSWRRGRIKDDPRLGSPEYRAKYVFMKEFVRLLHDLGAHEFARQYEWSTCKSQPNCLKRPEHNGARTPTGGLTAVDFRAGLTLLPFLPMSPGDLKLIAGGIRRGSLVQFDRGDTERLERYLRDHPDVMRDLRGSAQMLEELKDCEAEYRRSVPDITHNLPQLIRDRGLWRSIFKNTVRGWRVRNLIDCRAEARMKENRVRAVLFFLIGLLPGPGGIIRKYLGREEWRRHDRSLLTDRHYFARAMRGRVCEHLTAWHRAGRISAQRALRLRRSLLRCFFHRPLAFLPAGLHRFLTDGEVFREKLHFLFVRPFHLYFNASLRTQWLRDMVQRGRQKDILSEEDAGVILSRLDEPFIQKYMVSLVVHIMTLPVTQIVSLAAAGYFYWSRPGMSQAERTAAAAGIFALFQVIPLSPGSLCRGFYTTAMAIRDRSFREYNIALFLSYFKYVGYLAFPIQMTYRYPVLARFMAAHWATDAVRLVPVFGERGALLEHGIFCLFYNWPLTIRRRMARVARIRSRLRPRRRHLFFVTATLTTAYVLLHHVLRTTLALPPSASNLWLIRPLFPFIIAAGPAGGWASTRFAGGMARGRRVASSAAAGVATGILSSAAVHALEAATAPTTLPFWAPAIWRSFVLALCFTAGALITELRAKHPC